MGKPKACPSCGKEINETQKQKLQRKITVSLLKSIASAVPAGAQACEEHKDDCFKCFQKAVLDAIGPAYAGLMGKQMEEDQAEEGEQIG